MDPQTEKKLANKRGVLGWLNPYRLNMERWAYVFQRLTGLGILAYVLGHIGDTSMFVAGPFGTGPNSSFWTSDLSITENSVGHIILIFTVLLVGYHGLNGIRLILAEYGIIFQKPSRPEYPYSAKGLRTAQKHAIWLALVLAILMALWATSILFG